MSMVGRRENNQEKQHYRGNKLQFFIQQTRCITARDMTSKESLNTLRATDCQTSEHVFHSSCCIKKVICIPLFSGHPVVGQQKGEDQKSYVPYTVGACAFLVGVITGFLIMILLKKLKGDSPRISQDKYCTQNGYDTGKNISHFLPFLGNQQYYDNNN